MSDSLFSGVLLEEPVGTPLFSGNLLPGDVPDQRVFYPEYGAALTANPFESSAALDRRGQIELGGTLTTDMFGNAKIINPESRGAVSRFGKGMASFFCATQCYLGSATRALAEAIGTLRVSYPKLLSGLEVRY